MGSLKDGLLLRIREIQSEKGSGISAASESNETENSIEPHPSTFVPRVNGKFAPGVSGNPGGRPNETLDVRKFRMDLRDDLPEARERLQRLIKFGSDRDAVKAIELVFSYALGKPAQAVELSGPDGGPMQTESKTLVATVPLARDPEWRAKVAQLLQSSGALKPAKVLEAAPALGSASRGLPEGERPAEAVLSPTLPPGSGETA